MTWAKGQSGNPFGRMVRQKPFQTALMMELLRDGPDMPRLRRAINQVLDKAAEGDLEAVKFIADRTDGRAKQEIETTLNDRANIESMTTEEIEQRIAELEERRTRMPKIIEAEANETEGA